MIDAMSRELAVRVADFLPRFGAALGVFSGFCLGAGFLTRLLRKPRLASRVPKEIWRLLSRMAKLALLVIGLIMSLGTMGVDVSAAVAGLGLTSFALGFAVKDALSNVMAGVMTLIYQPFRVGDMIQVTGLEGVVQDIDLRYTTLESGGKRHLVPNAALFSNSVTILPSGGPAL